MGSSALFETIVYPYGRTFCMQADTIISFGNSRMLWGAGACHTRCINNTIHSRTEAAVEACSQCLQMTGFQEDPDYEETHRKAVLTLGSSPSRTPVCDSHCGTWWGIG